MLYMKGMKHLDVASLSKLEKSEVVLLIQACLLSCNFRFKFSPPNLMSFFVGGTSSK